MDCDRKREAQEAQEEEAGLEMGADRGSGRPQKETEAKNEWRRDGPESSGKERKETWRPRRSKFDLRAGSGRRRTGRRRRDAAFGLEVKWSLF